MMTGDSPWVRIVIVNYNAGPMLQACVNALASQTMPTYETVIVDNASEDCPISGLPAATNRGPKGSTAPWIAALNPDTRPSPDWLAELRSATERYPWATMF